MFLPFSTLIWHRFLKSFLIANNVILHKQCYICWYLGSLRRLGIRSNRVNLSEYFGLIPEENEWTMNGTAASWRHQMKTFSALLTLCEGNPPVTGGFPYKGQWRGSFIFSSDLRLKKKLSKQPRRRWFEMLRADYYVTVMRFASEIWCHRFRHQHGLYYLEYL